MPRPSKGEPKPSLGDDDFDDIQTLMNLLELHANLKREASSANKIID